MSSCVMCRCVIIFAEPIRKHLVDFPDAQYIQAECHTVDFSERIVQCRKDSESAQSQSPSVAVPYDQLVIAVGAEPATFNIPGVSEHCMFIKEIHDGGSFCTAHRHHILSEIIAACGERSRRCNMTHLTARDTLPFVLRAIQASRFTTRSCAAWSTRAPSWPPEPRTARWTGLCTG